MKPSKLIVVINLFWGFSRKFILTSPQTWVAHHQQRGLFSQGWTPSSASRHPQPVLPIRRWGSIFNLYIFVFFSFFIIILTFFQFIYFYVFFILPTCRWSSGFFSFFIIFLTFFQFIYFMYFFIFHYIFFFNLYIFCIFHPPHP